ncbi:peptidyl-tRNA hydrolase, PTH1 family [Tessaracoccus bendigoensis DSM 12906]|uniref:Peptidyl-tRNA hydrolase n=1 Tax=Tessaracoccus bendigoensis DSM 12906 TaxID=1123357 RepID=A0A1M6I537_9ACTN|nr:aminoacyl-tRNA hydrolase [Tessaracoccus bendigoensis]SHJ29494.1 peptidyl-tRNA hydrolase, PTH1 family [Tessaracoccus bendigoensis DSM 12906]
MSNSSYLVVGLGNPGPTYEFTRHNVGFWAVADLADRHGSSFSLSSRQRAEVAGVTLHGPAPVKLILAKPTTFMNDSGAAVKAVASFHKIPADHVIVIHDELDLDAGRLRVKVGGGDNGHNGLKSIRAHLGTGDFFRVRVGIGRPPGRQQAADYVLSKLKPAQLDELRVDAAVAADAVESLVQDGLTVTQNRFNG